MKKGQQVVIDLAPHLYAEYLAGGGPLERGGTPMTFIYVVDHVSICKLDYGTRYGRTMLLPTSWIDTTGN